MKPKRRSITHLIILASLIVAACTEQVDIADYLKSKPSSRLVVEGLITDEKKQHAVKLTRTGDALPDDAYEPVSGAEVTISDGTVIYALAENTEGSGIYLTDSIRGEAGNTYTLTVKLNGVVYEASDRMVAVLKFGRADGIILGGNTPPKGYVQSPLIVFGSDAPAMVNIKIDNPRPGDKYTHIDYYTFPGVDPDNILPKSVDASLSYDEGTQLTQTKYSLSPAHYLFLRALLLETEYKGGIFGSVRSNVPTNLSRGALGFFGASAAIRRTGVIGKDGRLH